EVATQEAIGLSRRNVVQHGSRDVEPNYSPGRKPLAAVAAKCQHGKDDGPIIIQPKPKPSGG
ncbi:hypothetical protein ACH4TQ_00005, partial [Streptomyces sp. NPDC021218]